MHPIYQFWLTSNSPAIAARPLYKTLSKQVEREAGEQFYREKLSGELTFVRDDYDYIMAAAFDTKIALDIYISYDAGLSWSLYWTGKFFRADCTIDEQDRIITVSPTATDQYDAVIGGLEKEYNLIDLKPEIVQVRADKRSMIQVYVPGEKTVACILGGMWWEQECEPEDSAGPLLNTYHFGLVHTENLFVTSGAFSAKISESGDGPYAADVNTPTMGYYRITRRSDGASWEHNFGSQNPQWPATFTPVSGTGAAGNLSVDNTRVDFFARLVTDLDSVPYMGTTYPIPADDIVPNNRNYSRVRPMSSLAVIVNDAFSAAPTEWGLYQPGQYYKMPETTIQRPDYFPLARNTWDWFSFWVPVSMAINEYQWRSPFILRDCYPLASVISVLLAEFAPGITHQADPQYSEFLYGSQNPISGVQQGIFITPKSNVVNANYDQPAQKAPVTLRQILDMLRDCYRCYWFIDDVGRFRIEHIQYFKNGGSYLAQSDVQIDITTQLQHRNGKPLAFGQGKYKYDKIEIAERYEFGWMDDVSQPFEGDPIVITSAYAEQGRIEKITVSNFTSDIDYILLNPGDVSNDGFVLLSAALDNGQYVLPYLTGGAYSEIQNGYAAFKFLQTYYLYDLPAWNYSIGFVTGVALGIKRLKVQEKVVIPAYSDPNYYELVKTFVGEGTIRKLSIDLQSRSAEATLEYDTE